MMRRRRLAWACAAVSLLLAVGPLLQGRAHAPVEAQNTTQSTPQTTTQTTIQNTPAPVAPVVPFAQPAPLTPIAVPDDARAAACPAARTPGFAPYIVRAGDRLDLLLAGHLGYSAAEVAAFNCLDALALPPGARIGLPADALAVSLDARVAALPAADPVAALRAPDRIALVNTERLALAWQAPAGSRVGLSLCPAAPDALCPLPRVFAPQPVAGVLTAEGFQHPGTLRFRLDWTAGTVVNDPVFTEVVITCAYPWLAPQPPDAPCPAAPPQSVFAVFQSFELGFMLYRGDTRTITVFVRADDGVTGTATTYADPYTEGQPDPAAPAPDGLFTPVRGFGAVWAALGGPAGGLGWALAPERGYDARVQAAGRRSYTTYLTLPTAEADSAAPIIALTTPPGENGGFWATVESGPRTP
jgi:hypothetical protein